MKRICFFVHFNKNDVVDDYVIYYLQGLKKVVNDIIFISNSSLNHEAKNKLSEYSKKIIQRENVGYDFMAWKDGIESIGYENLANYDEVIIANDSCYAPLFPFEEMFDKMSTKDCDFWGATDSIVISYHIQSYFIVFGKSVISSRSFTEFWKNVVIQKTKDDVVLNYEIGLSIILIKGGFKALSYDELGFFYTNRNIYYKYCDKYKNRKVVKIFKILTIPFKRKRRLDKSMTLWRDLIKQRTPFLKKKIINNIFGYEKVLEINNSKYPISLIKEDDL